MFIWTNRKVETKLYLFPIGPDRIVYLFGCLIVFKIRSQEKAKLRMRTLHNLDLKVPIEGVEIWIY